jgi:hypothetical protein
MTNRMNPPTGGDRPDLSPTAPDQSRVELPAGPVPSARPAPAGLDPRGPRFGAGLTAVLLVVVLLAGDLPPVALTVLAVVAAGFLVGAVRGPQGTWQGALFAAVVRPRLAPPTQTEDPRPPTFAQLVGLTITGAGLVLGLLGVSVAVPVAAALALVAAFLNAVFGLCLGCELYLLGLRLRSRVG